MSPATVWRMVPVLKSLWGHPHPCQLSLHRLSQWEGRLLARVQTRWRVQFPGQLQQQRLGQAQRTGSQDQVCVKVLFKRPGVGKGSEHGLELSKLA